MPYRDDDNEVLHPREYPDPDQEGGGPLPCPHCLGVIYEDVVRCPHCGMYMSEEDLPRRQPWWVIVGVLVCLAVSLYWIWSP